MNDDHQHMWGAMHAVAERVMVRTCVDRECGAVQRIDRTEDRFIITVTELGDSDDETRAQAPF